MSLRTIWVVWIWYYVFRIKEICDNGAGFFQRWLIKKKSVLLYLQNNYEQLREDRIVWYYFRVILRLLVKVRPTQR